MNRIVRKDTVTSLLADQSPDATAIIYAGERLTYADLDTLSRRMAAQLRSLGIGPGDRVAIWLPNTPAYMVIYLACARLAAIAVAVNTRYRAVEVADIVARSGARVLATWPGFRNIDFLGILTSIDYEAVSALEHVIIYAEEEGDSEVERFTSHSYRDLVDENSKPLDVDLADPEAGSNIFTTSGTTKAPKFVLHTQQSIVRHARAVSSRLAAVAGAQLQVLPLCGVFGFTQATASIAAGTPMVLMNAFDPQQAIDLIDRHDVHYLNATDDMIEALLDADTREQALPSVRYCGFGSFNSDPEVVIRGAESRGLQLVGLYGMSEVQALFAMQSADLSVERRMLGGGHLVSPQAAVRVRDVETGELLAHGEQGELEIKGPSLFREYFENPEATADAFTSDGFLRTGDMGYTVDEQSFVFLARMGDVLRLGGFLVSPVEIETYLQEHPSVAGCQVVAVNLAGRMRAVAFITLEPEQEFQEELLIDYCRDGLAGYKAPARVFELVEFPVTHSANGTKIQRARLREWASEWT
ncbi:MAG: AMP-binding protein [Pseudomonadales bacterium]|nr:AMP-binding protein [Pseudomonadales bacterium]MDP7597166.1 AMP-binding protein [Pseudomonadales bacterium]HJN48999.1 AMP-binding protein [Pseudomonadales bacterium]